MRWMILLLAASAGCAASRPAGPSAEFPSWALVRGDAGFRKSLETAFRRLERTRAGGILLERLGGIEGAVVIRQRRLPSGMAGGGLRPIVWWNPAFEAPETPAFVALHHELVHAYQRARGLPAGDWMESEAIGLAEFADVAYSENALRRELSLPPRASHRSLPGFTRETMSAMLEEAYAREGAARGEGHLPGPAWKAPRVDARIPDWVEASEP